MQAALSVALQDRFIVTTASTAAEGLHRLTASRSPLVILDEALPDFTSATFLRALRAHRPQCPVIVIVDGEETAALRDLVDFRIDGIVPRSSPLDVLFHRIDTLLDGSRRPERRPARQVGEVIKYVASHWRSDLVVATIAGALGLSRAHLAYLFQRETGMTVKEYATKVRIEVVKRLLVETDHKLEVIAHEVGFCDASHLSRVFRRVCGCPPAEYRRQAS
jgi:YesN/AraC family two-component response regulator